MTEQPNDLITIGWRVVDGGQCSHWYTKRRKGELAGSACHRIASMDSLRRDDDAIHCHLCEIWLDTPNAKEVADTI